MTYFEWPYYTLRNGVLFDEEGRACYTESNHPQPYDVPVAPLFGSVTEAEDWLHTYDQRGNVRS